MKRKFFIILFIFILLFSLFAISSSAAVTLNNFDTFPLGYMSPYVWESGYYTISLDSITTSMLDSGANRVDGEFILRITVPTANGAINFLANCDTLNFGNYYENDFTLDTTIKYISGYSTSGNVTSEEFNSVVESFSSVIGSSDFIIYRQSEGFFQGQAIFNGLFVISDTYCPQSVFGLYQNSLILETSTIFIVRGKYYFDFITGDELNLPDSTLNIDFVSNEQAFTSISFQNNSVYYDNTIVFNSSGWIDDRYQYLNYISEMNYVPSSSNLVLISLKPYNINQSFNKGYDEGYDEGYSEGNIVGYNSGYNSGYSVGEQVGYDNGLEDSLTTNFFGSILNTLDSLKLFDTISVLDIITTLIGLFVFLFVLKLIAGG